MQIERTHDMELVRSIMTHKDIYRHITDDGSPPASAFRPTDISSLYYLTPIAPKLGVIGVFLLHPHSSVCYEVHTCILPKGWGARAREATRACGVWMFNNTACERIITNVPVGNVLAERLALKTSMKLIGVNEKSIKRHGVLLDQRLYGCSKGEWLCQQQSRR